MRRDLIKNKRGAATGEDYFNGENNSMLPPDFRQSSRGLNFAGQQDIDIAGADSFDFYIDNRNNSRDIRVAILNGYLDDLMIDPRGVIMKKTAYDTLIPALINGVSGQVENTDGVSVNVAYDPTNPVQFAQLGDIVQDINFANGSEVLPLLRSSMMGLRPDSGAGPNINALTHSNKTELEKFGINVDFLLHTGRQIISEEYIDGTGTVVPAQYVEMQSENERFTIENFKRHNLYSGEVLSVKKLIITSDNGNLSGYTGDMEFFTINPFNDKGTRRFNLKNLFSIYQYQAGKITATIKATELLLRPTTGWTWKIPAGRKMSLSIFF